MILQSLMVSMPHELDYHDEIYLISVIEVCHDEIYYEQEEFN